MRGARIAGIIVGMGIALLLSGMVGVALAASAGALKPPQARLGFANVYLLAYTTTTPRCVPAYSPRSCSAGRQPRGYAQHYYVAWLLWYRMHTSGQPRELLLNWQPLALPVSGEWPIDRCFSCIR